MSVMLRIQEAHKDLTKSERKLAKIVLDERDKVIQMKGAELSDYAGVSPASVTRFAQKVGCKGFMQMRLELVQDSRAKHYDSQMAIAKDDSVLDLMQKVRQHTFSSLERTYDLVNANVLAEVVEALLIAKRIQLVGCSNLCLDFHHRLLQLGLDSRYEIAPFGQWTGMNQLHEDDLLFVVSYTGEAQDLLNAAQNAQAQGAQVVALTSYKRNSLHKLAQLVLAVPNVKSEAGDGLLVRTMSMAILDLLCYGIIQKGLV